MICVSKRSRNRFPPRARSLLRPDGGYLGRLGGSSGPGLVCDTKQSREQSVDDVRFTVKCNICPPPSSDPPPTQILWICFALTASNMLLSELLYNIRDAQFIRQSVRLQSNLWPDLTSFWTQSVTFFHLYGHKVSHMKIFPFIHSFIRLSEHTFPHFCTHKSECLLSCFHILDRMGFFVFVFLKHNNEHFEAAGIVWMQPVMPLLTPETHVWY